MKTLTYFLITDCFPWRPVGFDALLSNPEAINDCCTPELRFGYSECPIIWPRNLPPHLSLCLIFSQRDSESGHVPVQLMHSMEKETYSQLCSVASLNVFGSVWLLPPTGLFPFVSESICVFFYGSVGALREPELRKRNEINIYIIYVCVRES